MASLKGVYVTTKKDGSCHYRSSITFKNKHISLGSYPSESLAHKAYTTATSILHDGATQLDDYNEGNILPHSKWVTLHNFRDNGYYFKTPLYLFKGHFIYYLDPETHLYFDVDDLFYYSSHPIHRRGGYYFVNDYGMQLNILGRYNIRNHAILGKDYDFVDHNPLNLRYDNIVVHNAYHGVEIEQKENRTLYKARIHLNGNYIIGRYQDIHRAAIAYNKAVDFVSQHHISPKKFEKNYIETIDASTYQSIYKEIQLTDNLQALVALKKSL